MACDRFSAALTAHALGAAIEPPAAAHLAVCSECQAWLANERSLARMLDGAIDAIGSVEPPADFRVRLAERVTAQAASRMRNPASAGFSSRVSRAGFAAVAALVVVAAAIWWRPAPSPVKREPQAAVRQAGPDAVAPAADPERAAAPAPVAPVPAQFAARARATRQGRTPDAFEVLVPAGQRESLVRFVASLSQEDPAVASRLLGSAGELSAPPITEISEPVVIRPLVVPELVVATPILEH